MLGTVHALIGAALGTLCKEKSSAFVAGVASHIIADAIPHTDVSPEIDVPIMAGTLAVIGACRGVDSPEFWGALGGVLPDAEHGLAIAGIIPMNGKVFPTHINDGKILHGRGNGERWSQALIAAAAIALIVLKSDADA